MGKKRQKIYKNNNNKKKGEEIKQAGLLQSLLAKANKSLNLLYKTLPTHTMNRE